MSDKLTPPMINVWLRFICGICAVALAVGAIVVLSAPPIRTQIERDGSGKLMKATESPADMTVPFTVAFIAASGFLLYIINGYRITKFAAAGVEAVAEVSAADRADKYVTTVSPDDAVATNEVQDKSPEPTEAPSKVLTANGDSYSVFELSDIPFTVISDAIGNWPNDTSKPNNLGDFEFAMRKRGKGNHPWIIKFNGCPAVKVSYGGQAKTSATVEQQ